jgi:hypothetical protein
MVKAAGRKPSVFPSESQRESTMVLDFVPLEKEMRVFAAVLQVTSMFFSI